MHLNNARKEAYARERAKLVPKVEAYRLAGYSMKSINVARVEADPKVRARIVELTKENEEDIAIESYRMRCELRKIGYANTVDLWEWNGDMLIIKDLTSLPAEVQATISEIVVEPIVDYETNKEGERVKVVGGQKIKVKQHDKLSALSQLAKLLGMEAPSKMELSGANGGPIGIMAQPIDRPPRETYETWRARRLKEQTG